MPDRIPILLAEPQLPRAEALLLLAYASGRSREQLIAESGDPLPDAIVAAFRSLAARRAVGEPIAYLVGQREFYGRVFTVDRSVLIPRPETESLVDTALAFIDQHDAAIPCRVLDLGAGSGVIGITLKMERPAIGLVATDVSEAALAVARGNADRLGAEVRWRAGDWYAALSFNDQPFDLIVANPPYIAADDRHLREGDLRFEPRTALTDGGDGMAALRAIVADAAAWLTSGGMIAVEHGYAQACAVRALLMAHGFEEAASRRDLAGIERISSARAARRTHDYNHPD